MNHILSILGFLLLVVQPIASLYLIKETNCVIIYLRFMVYVPLYLWCIIHKLLIYKQALHHAVIYLGIGATIFGYLFLFIYSFYFSLSYTIKIIYLIFLFLFFTLFHFIGKGAGSLWCLFVNSIIIYFLIQILVIQPFNQVLETTPA